MGTAETILVIFLSAALLLFLILGIVLVSIAINILRNVKRIAQRAESATANVQELVAMVSQKVAPVAVSTAVAALLRRLKSKKD